MSNKVIGCAIEVHRAPGPGLLESTYEQCLAGEMELSGISFKLQSPLPVEYKGIKLDCGYRVDILVEDELIVEPKRVVKPLPVHEAGKYQGLAIDKFQCRKIKGRHKEIYLVKSSCPRRSSW